MGSHEYPWLPNCFPKWLPYSFSRNQLHYIKTCVRHLAIAFYETFCSATKVLRSSKNVENFFSHYFMLCFILYIYSAIDKGSLQSRRTYEWNAASLCWMRQFGSFLMHLFVLVGLCYTPKTIVPSVFFFTNKSRKCIRSFFGFPRKLNSEYWQYFVHLRSLNKDEDIVNVPYPYFRKFIRPFRIHFRLGQT